MSRRARQSSKQQATAKPNSLPILAIRNRVLFPGGFLRLSIGRPNSVRLIEAAVRDVQKKNSKKRVVLGIFTRKEGDAKKAGGQPDVFEMGTAARVVQLEKANSNQPYQYSVLVEGLSRIHLDQFQQQEPYYIADVAWLENKGDVESTEVKALALNLKESSRKLLDAIKVRNVPVIAKSKEFLNAISKSAPGDLADVLVSNLDVPVPEKQKVLEAIDLVDRMKLALELVENQLEVLSVSNKIQNKVDGKLNDTRREFYLRQQLKAIREELGEGEGGEEEDDVAKLQAKIDEANLPEAAQKVADNEIMRMKRMQPAQPEYNVIRTYLELIADLPWNKSSLDNLDPSSSMAQLDEDHFGLEKVKKRIVEYIAVRNLKNDMKGPLLCLVGPPGVGKTSLGKSIATALNREFARLSLGGVRDEAEIRGHRRTYIGAMPGTIIQAIRRAGTNNPVILLDEMDKLGSDHRGDPSAALLEVLDPAQNSTFTDHYLNLPFDLSKCFFMATANTIATMPAPLLDRMELLQLPGYTELEKLHIAERYLLPKQIEEHGLEPEEISISEDVITRIAGGWTREAGVRNLEREIANVCRKVAVDKVEWTIAHQPDVPEGADDEDAEAGAEAMEMGMAEEDGDGADELLEAADEEGGAHADGDGDGDGDEEGADEDEAEEASRLLPPTEPFPQRTIHPDDLDEILGHEKFTHEAALRVATPGVATGMAWTQAGGELLFIEAEQMKGRGKVTITGQLGDVMRESASLAMSWIRSHAEEVGELLGVDPTPLYMGEGTSASKGDDDDDSSAELYDTHIHFPAGAVPKDGPSAGVAITTALVSLLTGRCVRSDVSMTGEVTLRGLVLPVGGVKEKVLAAHRGDIKHVIIPERNEKDLDDLPEEVKKDLTFTLASKLTDALEVALGDPPTGDGALTDEPEADHGPDAGAGSGAAGSVSARRLSNKLSPEDCAGHMDANPMDEGADWCGPVLLQSNM